MNGTDTAAPCACCSDEPEAPALEAPRVVFCWDQFCELNPSEPECRLYDV